MSNKEQLPFPLPFSEFIFGLGTNILCAISSKLVADLCPVVFYADFLSNSDPHPVVAMADGGILGIIQRRNPEREFEILKQIGSGTYGEVYEVGFRERALTNFDGPLLSTL